MMNIRHVNVNQTIATAKTLLAQEKHLSPALKSVIEVIFMLMQVMVERLSLTSKNSSQPPSSDKNFLPKTPKAPSKRRPGGHVGRNGTQLKPVACPDKIELLTIDRRRLPKGTYQEAGYQARQVIEYHVSVCITEYRAQVLVDATGQRYVADFPAWVKRPIQYGPRVKANAVYLSQFQLIPYNRIEDYCLEHLGLSISAGSLVHFNQEAYMLLADFESIAKARLIASDVLHVDETGINVNGQRLWLHTAGNERWTYFYPHAKRGSQAIDDIGIIPKFQGVLCHDHWLAYYRYTCQHALCNAHHLRELEWAATVGQQRWATAMIEFLTKLKQVVQDHDGVLSPSQCAYYHQRYRALLAQANRACPVEAKRLPGQRGRMKQSKSRNLLERLIKHQADVLRLMSHKAVPFTNNQGEHDLRMTKVQQKISGCFRSLEGAAIFCRIRGYLITCRKHGVNATDALVMLFNGKLPDFINSS